MNRRLDVIFQKGRLCCILKNVSNTKDILGLKVKDSQRKYVAD